MPLSSVANGTITANGSEQTLASPSGPATYILVVDMTNLANGDVTVLRCKSKAKSGGSAIAFALGSYSNAQSDPLKMSIPVPSVDGGTFTLQQVAGTNRSYDWNLYAIT